jgi:CheY-like chemotaxis protein
LKTAFLNNISHEIRTPMNAIVGFSGFLGDPELSTDKREEFTEIIVQSSNQLLSIITDIVNIATIEAGQEKLDEKLTNLNSIFKHLHEQFVIKAQKQDIAFNYITNLPDNEADVLTDDLKFTEILMNLLGNAFKFTHHGYINFGYLVKEDFLEFYVEDSGIGIPPEMHDEIFKRFRQVECTTVRNFGGSGLGLSISKAYVELLGGKIWVISELEKGSTFYFTIPLKKANKNLATKKQFGNGLNFENIHTKTILIAEDEESNFILLKELLVVFNFNILWVTNGMDAVTICESNKHIDLVLMDIKMPVMDGYEATKQIREIMPMVPIIAQTAYTTDIDKNKALLNGCTDFITKPINRQLLISKIKEQLNKE